MNRPIKDAAVKRLCYGNHDQLRSHLSDFVAVYNLACSLKALKRVTSFESACNA